MEGLDFVILKPSKKGHQLRDRKMVKHGNDCERFWKLKKSHVFFI
jgi:hypothetical protein